MLSGTTGIKFGSNCKGGPQASNLGQIVRGNPSIKFGSNGKGGGGGGPQASNLGQIVRGGSGKSVVLASSIRG